MRCYCNKCRPLAPEPTPAAGPWIPVAERLPEVGQRVLAVRNGCAELGYFKSADCWYLNGAVLPNARGRTDITHWSPLYPPSEGEK